MIGTALSHFRITAKLGEGGMGEVYRAEDTKLGREVAIKVLPEAVAADPERLARFEREAKVLAALNHPNIAAIYSIESEMPQLGPSDHLDPLDESDAALDEPAASSVHFLVMELVEGEDLQQRIAKGSMPVAETTPIALQIAEALEAAHEKGVIHRDLKPANVKLTPEGQVKVLDFGLAKAMDPAAGDQSGSMAGNLLSMSPTLTAQMTQAGVILGTAAYMSPEQARGEEVDKRSDIWAFGVLLYEMLTGQKSFDGKTVTDVIAAVVTRDPDWTALPTGTPEPLKRLMLRCTRKEPHERLHDIADARLELAEGVANPDAWAKEMALAPVAVSKASRLGWIVAVAMTLVAAGLAIWRPMETSQSTATADPVWFRISEPPGLSVPYPNSIAVSRDGRKIAYDALIETEQGPMMQIYLRTLGDLEPRAIPGTVLGVSPFFSPDGQRLGFFTIDSFDLKIVELETGAVTTLVRVATPRGAVWRDDDVIFYGPDTESGLWRINTDGGESSEVTTPDPDRGERGHRFPDLLPDGRTILFTVASSDILTFDDARIDVMNLETGARTTVVEKGSYGRFVEPGYLVYAREGSLMAVSFDPETLETGGRSVKVVDGVTTSPLSGGADFAVSSGGTLAYLAGDVVREARQVVWADREGNTEPITEERHPYQGIECSPDGRTLALDIDAANANVWLLELERRTLVRLTQSRSNNQPIWTPDGERVAFSSAGGDGRRPYWQDVGGGLAAEEIPAPDVFWWPRSFSPDSSELVAELEADAQTNMDLWILPVSGDGEARPLLATQHDEALGRISPDGEWIAYQSNETGAYEVYIQSYPDLGNKIRVSRNGGERPVWSHDGRELFFASGLSPMNMTIASVPIDPGPPFRAGAPVELFETNLFPAPFDVCPDSRFVMIQFTDFLPPVRGVDVALDWTRTLTDLVPD